MYSIAPKKILSSFLLPGSHNVSKHAKHLVAHCNEKTGIEISIYFNTIQCFPGLGTDGI